MPASDFESRQILQSVGHYRKNEREFHHNDRSSCLYVVISARVSNVRHVLHLFLFSKVLRMGVMYIGLRGD